MNQILFYFYIFGFATLTTTSVCLSLCLSLSVYVCMLYGPADDAADICAIYATRSRSLRPHAPPCLPTLKCACAFQRMILIGFRLASTIVYGLNHTQACNSWSARAASRKAKQPHENLQLWHIETHVAYLFDMQAEVQFDLNTHRHTHSV